MVGHARAKCSATNKDGRPCSAHAWRDGLCRWHHPDLEERRAEGRRRGGLARSNQARARRALPSHVLSVDEVRGLLGKALRDVLSGTLEPGPANAAAALARSYLAASEASAIETLEREVAALRALMDRQASA